MQKTIVKEKISMQLETIVEHFQVISNYKEKISQIELDLLKEQVRNLYDNLYLLEKMNNLNVPDVLDSKKEVESEKISIPEPPKNIFKTPHTDSLSQPAEKIKSDREYEPEIKIEVEKKPLSSSKPSYDLFDTQPSTIAEKYAGNSQTLNDNLLKQQKEKILAEELQLKHIAKLKSAIGINDKFLFINELFEGNMREYDIAITQLDNFHSFNDALEYINQMNEKFEWSTNSTSLIKLKDFLKRRYPE
jgi:hypothetical protein